MVGRHLTLLLGILHGRKESLSGVHRFWNIVHAINRGRLMHHVGLLKTWWCKASRISTHGLNLEKLRRWLHKVVTQLLKQLDDLTMLFT